MSKSKTITRRCACAKCNGTVVIQVKIFDNRIEKTVLNCDKCGQQYTETNQSKTKYENPHDEDEFTEQSDNRQAKRLCFDIPLHL